MRLRKKVSRKVKGFAAKTAAVIVMFNSLSVSALAATDVEAKITTAANTIKGILTGLVAIVAICVSLFIIIKRMPDADNPQEKYELYRGVGRVWALVALAAACIWIIPWVYSLFT